MRVQLPLRLDDYSEPVPDFALLTWRQDHYAASPVTAVDALLVIEVSHSSLRYDREVKLPLYARCRIPEYWMVDVEGRRLHLFHTPRDNRYAYQSSMPSPGAMTLQALPDLKLDLAGLFDGLHGS